MIQFYYSIILLLFLNNSYGLTPHQTFRAGLNNTYGYSEWLDYFIKNEKKVPVTNKLQKFKLRFIKIYDDSVQNFSFSDEQIKKIMHQLNTAFVKSKIQFLNESALNITIKASVLLDDLVYSSEMRKNLSQQIVENKNTIDIYILSRSSLFRGYTEFPNGTEKFIFIDRENINDGETLIHEMGHFFGLLHTYEEGEGLVGQSGALQDYVKDSVHCKILGDRICDTPADPFRSQYFQEDCQLAASYTDLKTGLQFQPLMNNYMSFYHRCRRAFTPEQAKRMNRIAELVRSDFLLTAP